MNDCELMTLERKTPQGRMTIQFAAAAEGL